MANIYYPDNNKTISEFLSEIIDINSTVVIPDLQRPYIWNPNQVILLVDSIFKKWPFGSLLCWDVKKSEKLDFIPFRGFWEEVCRNVPKRESKQASYSKDSNKYLMILDGQQRIQSLLLALGGDSWGFTLTDKEWRKHLEGKDDSINPDQWSTGCLCLDTEKFLSEYNRCNNIISSIEVGKCLSWVITDIKTGSSSSNKRIQVLPTANEGEGRYLRFSKLWNIAKPSGRMTYEYESYLKNIFDYIQPEIINNYIKPLSEFMMIIADVKESTTLSRLIVKEFEKTSMSDRKLYNDAIVNIFARLNTAGRALTPQEITLAWLKTGWREANESSSVKIDCANSLDELLKDLNDTGDDLNCLKINMDNLVDILSLFWIIISKDNRKKENLLLSDKDLIDGSIIKDIGIKTFLNWEIIRSAVLDVKDTYDSRKLYECYSRSYYAFYVLCGWKFIVSLTNSKLQGRVRETECWFDNFISNGYNNFIDRWYFCTQLSDTWSSTDNYPSYISDLCDLYNETKNCSEPHKAGEFLVGTLDNWISSLRETSINRIRDIRAYNRLQVISYKNLLWFWNRLDTKRWEIAIKPMKRASARPKIEVDHSVPVVLWEKKVESIYPQKDSTDATTGTEQEMIIGDQIFKRSDVIVWINQIGNCSLLLRSHNRSKKDEQFGIFLKDIRNEKEIIDFKESFFLTDNLLFPEGKDLEEIIADINSRTNIIKNDLIEFIVGNNKRIDLI